MMMMMGTEVMMVMVIMMVMMVMMMFVKNVVSLLRGSVVSLVKRVDLVEKSIDLTARLLGFNSWLYQELCSYVVLGNCASYLLHHNKLC